MAKTLKTVGDAIERLKNREYQRRVLIHRRDHIGVFRGGRHELHPSQVAHLKRVEDDLASIETDIRLLKRRELAVA